MPRRSPRHADLIAIADSQMGLVTAAQLAQLGVQSSTVSRRLAGGMWTRVLPGVHLVGGGRPSRHQRLRAALLYGGDGAVITGTSGLRSHGFRALRLQELADDEPERPEPVHILIPHDRRRLSTGFVRVERTHRLPDSVLRHGLTVAEVPRAVGDAARRFPRESDAVAVVAEAVQRNFASIEDLRHELDEGPVRGSRYLRLAVAAVADGARSVPEADVARLLASAGFHHVVLNPLLVTESGEYVAEPDVWLDDVGLAVEVDSIEHHAGGANFERTIRRNARYAAAGVPVIAVLPSSIRDRPSGVLHDITRARDAAASRPRARVRTADRATRSAGRRDWPWGA